MRTHTLKELNSQEKPREKLNKHGTEILTNEELLSLIIRSGRKGYSAINLARDVIKKFGGFKEILNSNIIEITKIKGIGIAKAAEILAACEIARRINNTENKNLVEIKKPEDIFNLLRGDLYGRDKEYFYVINLNSRNRVISKDKISIGTVNQTTIYQREIYKNAITKNAVSIIVAHNHPSNDPTPSEDDIRITEDIAKMGKTLGIPLVDHLIICDNTFLSFKALNIFKTYNFPQKKEENIHDKILINHKIKNFIN